MSREQTKCKTSIGGQALIEGILMRGPKETSISVRMQDGSISSQKMNTTFLKDKYKIFKYPILRGLAGLIDSMTIGYKALMISAEKSGFDEAQKEPSKFDNFIEKVFGDKMMNFIMVVASVLGIILSLLLFFILPTWLFNICAGGYERLNDSTMFRSIFEGILRIIIFIVYIAVCSKMKDLHRVFQYHGAEHKTIFCYENEEELTVENVKKHSRFHPRCGTSFIVIMLLVGIIVGFFIPFSNPFLRTFIKILCIPIIVGVGYELIKICGKYDNIVTRAISAPGMWLQRITTKNPTDDMIEVAINALKDVIPENGEDKI